MLLYLHQKLSESRLTDLEFFETAYVWRFGKLNDLSADYSQWKLHSIIPKYVVDFLKYMQSGETSFKGES